MGGGEEDGREWVYSKKLMIGYVFVNKLGKCKGKIGATNT